MKSPWQVLRGQERLSTVFGLYCVLGIAILTMLFGMFVGGTEGRLPDSAYGIAGLVYAAYFLWAHVSLWMCAFNTKRRAWGLVARAYVAVVLAVITTSLVRSYLAPTDPDIEVLRIQ